MGAGYQLACWNYCQVHTIWHHHNFSNIATQLQMSSAAVCLISAIRFRCRPGLSAAKLHRLFEETFNCRFYFNLERDLFWIAWCCLLNKRIKIYIPLFYWLHQLCHTGLDLSKEVGGGGTIRSREVQLKWKITYCYNVALMSCVLLLKYALCLITVSFS